MGKKLRLLCAADDRAALQPVLDALKAKGVSTTDANGKADGVLLAVLSVWIFFECGRLGSVWLRRKRLDSAADAGPVVRYEKELRELLARTVREEEIQNLLRKRMQETRRRLDKFLMAIRIGPALGLIGTLVPMGTALAGLGQGDFSVMTSELVLAYTTTVVGLLIGSLSYVIYMIRRRFTEDDIREMEYLTEKLYHEIHARRS